MSANDQKRRAVMDFGIKVIHGANRQIIGNSSQDQTSAHHLNQST